MIFQTFKVNMGSRIDMNKKGISSTNSQSGYYVCMCISLSDCFVVKKTEPKKKLDIFLLFWHLS